MPILRLNQQSGYTKCSNEHVHQSHRIGFGARGLLGYMLSHGEGWKFTKSKIKADTPKEGREAVDSLIDELVVAGHVKIVASRESGEFDGYEWFVSEDPIYTANHTENGKPSTVNRARETVNGNPYPTKDKDIEKKER